jgi:hypothetical protein
MNHQDYIQWLKDISITAKLVITRKRNGKILSCIYILA